MTLELMDSKRLWKAFHKGTLHMKWDNGRTLGIVPGEDQFRVISKPTEETMDNDQKQGMGGLNM